MSFNSNFAPPGDEPDFDGQLPADFAGLAEQLGEQLQADAQRLSNVYPACQPPTKLMAALAEAQLHSQRSWSQRNLLAVVTSVAAAVLLVAGLIVLVKSPTARQTASDVPTTQRMLAVETPPANLQEPAVAKLPGRGADLQPVSFRPAVVDVNGPELEGLLDLWQEQAPPDGSISF